MDAFDFFSTHWVADRSELDVTPLAIWGGIKRATGLLDGVLTIALEKHGLTVPEFEVLAALVRSGPPYELRPTELTSALLVTAGAVTARLAHLEARGLIIRRKHSGDRRVQFVTLSAKGLQAFAPAFDALLAECASVLHRPEAIEREEFFRLLSGFLGNLDVAAGKDGPALEGSISTTVD